MKKGIFVLLGLMVILASFTFVRAESDINQTFGNLSLTNHGITYKNEVGNYIDVEIIKSLFIDNQTKVHVNFDLRDLSNITYEGASTDEQLRAVWESQKAYFRNYSKEILENLSAEEFEAESTENDIIVIILSGNITLKGLIKLSEDPRIKLIATDRGGVLAQGTKNQTLPYVDPVIYQKFDNEGWVDVIVRTIDNSNITINPEDPVAKIHEEIELRKRISSNLTDLIVAELPENKIRDMAKLSNGFGAFVTREVLALLANDSRITRIDYSTPQYGTINDSVKQTQNKSTEKQTENQTEIKTPETTKPQSFFQKIISFFRRLFGRE